MTPCCANSHLFVPLRVLTLWTSLHTYYRTHILTSIRLAYNRYSCIWTHVLRTHVCLCPGECSHSEPLCIHAYTHKYTHIVLQILLYMTPCCANSHMFVPLRALTPRTSLHIFTSIHKSYHRYFVYEPVLSELTYVCMCVPLPGQDHGLGQISVSNNLPVYCTYIYMYVKFSFGTHGLIFPFFSISHWTFFPKWMAIRVCKHCRKRAAKLKWQ